MLSSFYGKDLQKELFSSYVKGTPLWMEKKLDEDFERYDGTFYTKEDLLNFIKLNQPDSREVFFFIEIRDGRVYLKNSFNLPIAYETLSNERIKVLYQSLKLLNKVFLIKNSYYLICLEDSLSIDKKIPILTFAKIKGSYPICIPDFEALRGYYSIDKNIEKWIKKHPFDKKIEKAFWRGSTTGGIFTPQNWKIFPRSKLTLFAAHNEKICDAKFTDIVQVSQLDFPFVKEEMRREGILGPPMSIEEHLRYKYLIDIDGNSCTYSRLYWILKSNSLCLKHSSVNEQWYYKGLEPYVHYIPLKEDISDLEAKILWAKNHSDKVEKIIQNANEFANQSLKHSDALLYFYKVLERYQKLLH